MVKKIKAVPGLDYSPVVGEDENLSFGVTQADPQAKVPMCAEAVVFRRLFPVQRPDLYAVPWRNPTCEKLDVLLPPGASEVLMDAQLLCRTYDQQCFANIRDLVIMINLRFPEVDQVAGGMRLHEAWELARGFAMKSLVEERGLAVVQVLHVPARAARPGPAHVHLLAPARALLPSGFGHFARPLASDEGRALMDAEWAAWRAGHGH